MQTTLDCFPCLLRQVLQGSRFAKANYSVQRRILDLALRQLADSPPKQSPLVLASSLYGLVRRETGETDPYRAAKEASNAEALSLLPAVQDLIKRETDPLGFALKAAVAGNIMDYGCFENFDVSSLMEQLNSHQFTLNDRDDLETQLETAKSLTYFADNAGEIVFDRLLIEQLVVRYPIKTVRLVVRSEPFLNDALEEDALTTGMTQIPGLELHALPVSPADHDLHQWARATASDLIIAKGMANFENYGDLHPFYFLFIAKCEVIANLLTQSCSRPVSQGDWILHAPKTSARDSLSHKPEPVLQPLET